MYVGVVGPNSDIRSIKTRLSQTDVMLPGPMHLVHGRLPGTELRTYSLQDKSPAMLTAVVYPYCARITLYVVASDMPSSMSCACHYIFNRAVLGIEPRTSRTQSENHTTRPNSHKDPDYRQRPIVFPVV